MKIQIQTLWENSNPLGAIVSIYNSAIASLPRPTTIAFFPTVPKTLKVRNMVLNAESSNIQNVLNTLPNKRKPPNISNSLPSTPKTQQSPTLSYADASQKTPTQIIGKRTHSERSPVDHRRTHSPGFKSPRIASGYEIRPLRPQLEPLILAPASQEPDHVMQDSPFNNPSQSPDWSEEHRYYTRLNKIQNLLKDLLSELDGASNDNYLGSIIEDEETDVYLNKLAAILPSYTSNSMISPVIQGISNIQDLMGQFTKRLQRLEESTVPPVINKSLSGSIHARPISNGTSPSMPSPPTHTHNQPTPTQIQTAPKPKPTQTPGRPPVPQTPMHPTTPPDSLLNSSQKGYLTT
jgi:hypothetical protein